MTGAQGFRLLLLTACASAVLPRVAEAQEQVTASATATTTLGYANNPFSTAAANSSSGFVEINVQPRATMRTEKNIYSLYGGVRYQRYFQHYANSASYQASFDYRGSPSQNIKTHLNLGFDSSIIGAAKGGVDSPIDPSLPDPPVNAGVDLSLFGTRLRRSSLSANGNVLVSMSAHDNLSVSAFFNASRYQKAIAFGDYDGYGGTAGYDRQVSEHVRAGVQASIARSDYRGSLSVTTVYSGQATLSAAFSARWKLDSAIGLSVVNGNVGGSHASLSGSARLCRVSERGQLCANARRAVLPTGASGTQNSTSIDLSYSYSVTERGKLWVSADYRKNGNSRLAITNADESIGASAGYQQVLSQRVSLVTSGFYRKISGGPVRRDADFGGQLGLWVVFGAAR